MSKADDRLNQWLRDAHAMEMQAEQMLTAQSSRIESYPELRSRILDHLDETRDQARRLEECIARRGGDTSTLKDLMGQATAIGQGVAGMFASDEVIKGSLASYTFEHMEIASYKVLIAAAKELEDTQTSRVCQDILQEEEEMQRWLGDNIGAITREYLDREENGYAEAKR